MDIKYILFSFICLLHISIWVFVLTAFISKKTAKINIYIVIPFIYIVHILPFHLLMESKKILYKDKSFGMAADLEDSLIIPKIFKNLTKFLEKKCMFSPISVQGQLIFGLLTCIFRLYPIKFSQIFK